MIKPKTLSINLDSITLDYFKKQDRESGNGMIAVFNNIESSDDINLTKKAQLALSEFWEERVDILRDKRRLKNLFLRLKKIFLKFKDTIHLAITVFFTYNNSVEVFSLKLNPKINDYPVFFFYKKYDLKKGERLIIGNSLKIDPIRYHTIGYLDHKEMEVLSYPVKDPTRDYVFAFDCQ